MSQYVFLFSLWCIYFFFHSALATTRVKQWLHGLRAYYRLVYSVFSLVGLIGIVVYLAFIPVKWLWVPTGITRFVGLAMATYGTLLLRHSFKHYRLKEFLGIDHLSQKNTQPVLITSGLLAKVRHPLYSATMLLAWGLWVFAPHYGHLVSVLCIQGYLFMGTWFEEQKLEATFGESYRQYKKEVPMFVPKLR